jgi:hypothetical protein
VENLDHLNVGWLGVFIAPTTKLAVWWRLSVAWCTGQSGAHRTLSGAPATSPGRWDSTVGASDFWARLDVWCTPDMNCRLSGAPSCACLTSARFWRAFNASAGNHWREVVIAPLLHRTVRWIIAERIPEASEFRVALPLEHRTLSGVHRTVRWIIAERSGFSRRWRVQLEVPWCTGHCPVAHRTVRCARPGSLSGCL